MVVSLEKIQEAIATLHAAEAALLKCDPADGSYGALAGRCAIAAVYLETSVQMAGESIRHYRAVGENC
ncbi:hypothetical protein SAMN05445504_2406 [Burkholderia sp. CF099]|nr:hypothetical protein SAMN05445504_2406 [Burkholderia sp. CF099]